MTSDLVPAQLRCEYLVDPLGIDANHPRLIWISEFTRRDRQQSAYQILVGSSRRHLTAARGDMWDNGKVSGDESAHVAYKGPKLRSAQRYWWAIRVWDQDDGASSYSQAAWWEMGILRPDDWHGDWIGLDATALGAAGMRVPEGSAALPGLRPSPYLRTVLTVAKPLARARLYITARGLYEARLNGHRVDDALLTPGWTDYHTRIQYQAYYVTALLRPGENILGAIMGAGWYSGYIGFGDAHACYGDDPALLASLHIEHTDGTTQAVVSDSSWRGAIGPIMFSDLLMDETYDARHALSG